MWLWTEPIDYVTKKFCVSSSNPRFSLTKKCTLKSCLKVVPERNLHLIFRNFSCKWSSLRHFCVKEADGVTRTNFQRKVNDREVFSSICSEDLRRPWAYPGSLDSKPLNFYSRVRRWLRRTPSVASPTSPPLAFNSAYWAGWYPSVRVHWQSSPWEPCSEAVYAVFTRQPSQVANVLGLGHRKAAGFEPLPWATFYTCRCSFIFLFWARSKFRGDCSSPVRETDELDSVPSICFCPCEILLYKICIIFELLWTSSFFVEC